MDSGNPAAVWRYVLGTLALLVTLGSAPAALAQQGGGGAAKPPVEGAFGKGITVRSLDDQASMNVRARIQIRATGVRTS